MSKTPLKAYLETNSQASLAQAVGLTQGAISKMLLAGRNVFVVSHQGGTIELVEEKQIANSKPPRVA